MARKMKFNLTVKNLAMAAMLCLIAGIPAANADTILVQTAAQYNAAPAAVLQVTGTASRFSISANHANVQDALKLIFDQAGRQFALDNNVTGQITMRLTEQPLAVTLEAVCRQSFLHYRTDANTSITYFERDDNAVRMAFSRLRSLDSAMRDQLRFMGLSVPNDNSFQIPQGYNGALINPLNDLNGTRGGNAPGGTAAGGAAGRAADNPVPAAPEANTNGKAETQRPHSLAILPQGPAAVNRAGTQGEQTLDLSLPNDMQQFLQANNFVSFHIPADKPEPVYSVLQSLAQQAKVTMLIDPAIPGGSKFTLRGSISPRPLAEALNILAPYARLEWRWIGSAIYVQTAPDFALFYGEEQTPRARYAPQSLQRKSESAVKQKTETPPAPQPKP